MKANFESLYDHIGYLFYALANEQKPLSAYDIKKLETEISESWQPLTSAESNLHYSLIKHLNNTITDCFNRRLSSAEAFDIFEEYYLVHHVNFGPSLQGKILNAANEISHEFFSLSKNKEGSHTLAELKKLLHPPVEVTKAEGCGAAIHVHYTKEMFDRKSLTS